MKTKVIGMVTHSIEASSPAPMSRIIGNVPMSYIKSSVRKKVRQDPTNLELLKKGFYQKPFASALAGITVH
jgi:hypothetical protein